MALSLEDSAPRLERTPVMVTTNKEYHFDRGKVGVLAAEQSWPYNFGFARSDIEQLSCCGIFVRKCNTRRRRDLIGQGSKKETPDSVVQFMAARNWGFRMPYYFFDLVVDEEFKHQGGLILENVGLASERAEQLANELCVVLPELKKKGCAVRVTDSENKELCRIPLDPAPTWMRPAYY